MKRDAFEVISPGLECELHNNCPCDLEITCSNETSVSVIKVFTPLGHYLNY